MKKIIITSIFLSSCLFGQEIFEGFNLNANSSKLEKEYTCVPLPPPKPPAQHSGAEGLPPLPLPAVPLRRTEKKNPPRPPTLIAKVTTKNKSDWATNPSDTENLLKWMAKNLNVNFSSINLPEDSIPSDPQKVPLLYRTGHEPFTFSENTREKLRNYIIGGGTIIFDSCCGRQDFFNSSFNESKLIIPERPPYRLSKDHPIYHSFFDVDTIKYRKWVLETGLKNDVPSCIGIDIECRTAIFIFRWDLSCGWDNLPDSEKHHCLGYDIDTAKQLGSNLMSYITAERSAALPLSKAIEFIDETKISSGKFIVGQIKYNSIWKTRETALPMLLDSFYEQTKIPVKFAITELSLDSPRIFDLPFVYMTGHNAFSLSESERQGLKYYVSRGGTILIESCCGREAFDVSIRKELYKTFNQNLEEITSSEIYVYPNQVITTNFSPALAKVIGKSHSKTMLYGIKNEGLYSVIYSPYGLSCGWSLSQCPYCKSYKNEDAMAIGVNILSYVILN